MQRLLKAIVTRGSATKYIHGNKVRIAIPRKLSAVKMLNSSKDFRHKVFAQNKSRLLSLERNCAGNFHRNSKYNSAQIFQQSYFRAIAFQVSTTKGETIAQNPNLRIAMGFTLKNDCVSCSSGAISYNALSLSAGCVLVS